jgi:hypothetical protein
MHIVYHGTRVKFFVLDDYEEACEKGLKKTCFIFKSLELFNYNIAKECYMTIISDESLENIAKTLQKAYTVNAKALPDPLSQYFTNKKDLEIIRQKSIFEHALGYKNNQILPEISEIGITGFKLWMREPVAKYLSGFGSNFESLSILDIIKETRIETFDHVKAISKSIHNKCVNLLF